jgi:phage gpG-like protein
MAGVKSAGQLTVTDLSRRLGQVRTPAFRAQLGQLMAATAGKLIADGFRRSMDPYGKPWAPLKVRHGKPLLDTGRLRASFASAPLSNGFRIDATAAYAPFHQYGTKARRSAKAGKRGRAVGKGIPQRQMVPMVETGGIPESWQAAFNKDTARLLTRIGGGS